MHVGQGRIVVEVVEKDIRTEHRGDDCADTVEGLRNVDANFRVSGRTTDCACQRFVYDRRWTDLPVMKGLAAVSSEPSPLPIMKMDMQKPANDLALIHGIAINAPTAYKQRPQMKTALYE